MENSRTVLIRGGRGRWRTAAILALALFACSRNAPSGDILRGGATSSGAPTGAGAGGPTSGASAAASAKEKTTDRLARTTQAITSVRDMQNAAAAAAAVRPNVPNGLQTGGLKVAAGANANWTGAKAPQQQGSTIYIKQKESEAVLHWETFNVGAGTTVRYDQSAGGSDSGDWIAFNKVFDPSGKPSQILGKIQAEGQVFIINQNGIVFGAGSQVNTRALVASSLPINDNLIELGLLNNRDAQFLFSALNVPGGSDGTPAFIPPPPVNGVIGDVVVEAGAFLESPVNADGNGGRVMLVGANVRNDGIISTPNGQTILAAGLQVGIAAHDSEDPSLRGLDVWIGSAGSYDAAATNNGLIESLQGSVIMAGKAVNQMGVINSSTDVDLNGRIDLLASYGAVGNPNFDNSTGAGAGGPPFLNQYTGEVTLGANSVTMVLPNYASTKTIPGVSLPEASQINILGGAVNFRQNSILMAPSGDIVVRAGTWPYVDKDGNGTTLKPDGTGEAGLERFYVGKTQTFLLSGGQIFLEPGALVDASGTTDVFVALAQNLVTVQLRGFELADMPLQRDSEIRGISLVVDLRVTGEYGGETWYGTPLGDLSGVVDVIQSNVSQLTTAGGTVTMEAGDSIVLQPGSTVDVSGGYYRYEGGFVQTTRLVRGPNIIGIEDATPNVLYDGIYTGKSQQVSEKWGVSKSYSHPLAPTGGYTQQEYVQGSNGGTITLNAPTLLLGGDIMGEVIQGPRQQDAPPELASLNLSFTAEKMLVISDDNIQFLEYSPFAPLITVTNDFVPGTFTQAAKGGAWPATIDPALREEFALSTSLYTEGGFGKISIKNSDGDFVIPAGTVVKPPPGGGLAVEARNILIEGSIIAPGGDISLTAYNYSPYLHAEKVALNEFNNAPLPLPDPTRGIITLAPGSTISTAGLFIDERPGTTMEFGSPHVLGGGSIALEAFTINLEEGSILDVSGGVLAKATGKFSYGNGGDISLLAGRDPAITDLIGGELQMDARLFGYSVEKGGSLAIQAQLIQIGGGASSDGRLFAVSPEFFQQGGFSDFSLTGIGAYDEATGRYTPAVRVVAGTTIEPRTESWTVAPYQSPSGQLGVVPTLKPVGLRPPASISLSGLGADDPFTLDKIEAIGLVVMEEGTKILTDPGARVELQGEAIAVLGEVRAPGGTIIVSGADKYPIAPDLLPTQTNALPTVYIGPNAVLSAAGTAVLLPDPYGRRSGYVYPGGTIRVSGNIIAETGALLNVSGASAILDFHPTRLAGNGIQSVPWNAGLNSTPWDLRTVPVQVDSDGGLIVLRGGQMMYSNATLLGEAGGPTALGGMLAVSSGRFYPSDATQTGADINLIVEQSGNGLLFGDTGRYGDVVGLMTGMRGYAPAFETNVANGGIGYFAVDQFTAGGFDSLDLGYEYRENASPIPFGGNVEFRGPISINARGSVRIAGGGVVMADSSVAITASYIAIGQAFRPPTSPDDPFIPFRTNDPSNPGAYYFPATTGAGSLNLAAGHIDIGTVSMQGIGSASIIAADGDIRGNGTLEIAGDLTLSAAQVYPTTLADFNIFAFDRNIFVAQSSQNSPVVTLASAVLPPGFGVGSPLLGSTVIAIDGATVTLAANANTNVASPAAFVYDPGSGFVTIVQNGRAETPLSVGGNLAIYASQITQGGTLKAPLGTITLGWDGTDLDPTDADLDTPVSPISGPKLAVPTSNQVTLTHGSVTSVSALDLAGQSILIPYGLSPDGLSWIDPRGVNVTASGLPEKRIAIAGNKVTMQSGSTIDIRGGGDLLAFRWVQGNGGTVDLLGTASQEWGAGSAYESGDLVTYNGQTWSARVAIDPTNFVNSPAPSSESRYWTLVPESYAVVPGFASTFAPYNAFNPDASALGGDPGYTSANLGLGDQIYLDGGSGLPAGYYTLLPSRYALMPGAFLITPQGGPSLSTDAGSLRPLTTPDGATYVTGYRFNAFNSPAAVSPVRSLYEVASSAVVQSRAEYDLYLANTFMPQAAARLDLEQVQQLPNDSGYLSFSGNTALQLEGAVLTTPGGVGGRGATIDIASFEDIFIVGGSGKAVGSTVVLNAALLSSWGAESLLIGGLRYEDADGVHVDVRAPSVTLDNPGSVLEGSDITLVANKSLVVTAGSSISSTRPGSQPVDTFLIDGDGALLRVGSNPGSSIVRSNVTGDPSVSMVIGAGAEISGISVILDSTYATSLDPAATLDALSLQLGSGQISIVLDDSVGALTGSVVTPHLILQGDLLADVQNSRNLTLLSYTSIDVYGSGSFGNNGLRSISFLSGGIRGYQQYGGTVVFKANNISFGDPVDVATLPALVGPNDGSLQFDTSTVRFGDNNFAVAGYQNLIMNATGGVLAGGEGAFSTTGNLSIFAPLITGADGSKTDIVAGGDLLLKSVEGKAEVKSGLGATISFEADSIVSNTRIVLPSGLISMEAETGITIGGELNVEGSSHKFYDLVQYADAGNIVLQTSSGNVALLEGSIVSVAADAEGGNSGTLAVGVSQGNFLTNGELRGEAADGYKGASLILDVGQLPVLSAVLDPFGSAGFNETMAIRVRTNDVLIDGVTKAHDFSLAADGGGILVQGTIDASGVTGGSIALTARDSLTLAPTAILTVAAEEFSNAGKGGSVRLEGGAAIDGMSNPLALVDIQAGSLIDLSVAEYAKYTPVDISAGALPDYQQVGTAAFSGRFQGTLHIRAPQTAGADNLQVATILGTINGASNILVEGYRVWDLTNSGGQITGAVQQSVKDNGNAFGANSAAIKAALFSGDNADLARLAVVTAGAEIISAGDLILGTPTSLANADWDLSSFRYGPDLTPGILTLRAQGDLVFNNTLSDGFTPVANTAANGNSTMWLAPLMAINPNLPTNLQSWSYRLTAGSDLGAADYSAVLSAKELAPGKGSVLVGEFYPAVPTDNDTTSGGNGLTANSIRISTTAADQGTRYEVIRTGTGDIDIHAGLDVQLRNQFATIYTAGAAIPTSVVTSIYSPGDFVIPTVVLSSAAHPSQGSLGAVQQNYAPQWSLAGGNVSLSAQGDIWHATMLDGEVIVDSSRQMPNNWLYRRGYVDPTTGEFGVGGVDSPIPVVDSAASTTWWINYSNFFEGVGALGGGNVTLTAGGDVINVDALAPTNARMPGRVRNADLTYSNVKPDAAKLLELGGGDVLVKAGGDISGGIYYVERGHGTLIAGGDITTNEARSPSLGILNQDGEPVVRDPLTWLPTTLFVGKSTFDVSAQGDVLLGPAVNTFLMPQGLNNKFWYKTYFNTFSADAGVNVVSIGGSITHRLEVTLSNELQPGEAATSQPILSAWVNSQYLFDADSFAASAAYYQPWLRLAEADTSRFDTMYTVNAPNLSSTAFGGDINIVGTMNLFPSPTGNIELAAAGSISGLQPSGKTSVLGTTVTAWTSASISLSDASPGAAPGVASPLAYQALVGRAIIPLRDGTTDPFDAMNQMFLETGSYTGAAAAADVKQALHDQSILHAGDTNPVRIYAAEGDVTGVTLFTPKFTQIAAGNDITDVAFYIQNVDETDISIVTAGRDIIPSNENAPLRSLASDFGAGNVASGDPLPGDIQISGPGTLEVLAGRNIDLGTGPNEGDGTGTGITSIGRSRNPALDIQGADLVALAGVKGTEGGAALGLSKSTLDVDGFIDLYGIGEEGSKNMTEEQEALAALNVLFGILEDSASTGVYDEAFSAIGALFGTGLYEGDILTRSRDVRTVAGGSITMLAPGGGLSMSSDIIGNPLTPPGVVTEFGGEVNILTQQNVEIGAARIFTLRGGDLTIWSSEGDIAAGTAPKTVVTAPPTRVVIDANSADVQTDLGGLATGGGIGVLAAVESVEPGNVYLIAPGGTVDAGDAGIRSTGDITIAAVQVLNADNIAAGGQTSGVPAAPPAAVPNIGGLTTAANTTGAASNVANEVANQSQQPAEQEATASVYTVEVLGYGGGEDEEEEEKRENN